MEATVEDRMAMTAEEIRNFLETNPDNPCTFHPQAPVEIREITPKQITSVFGKDPESAEFYLRDLIRYLEGEIITDTMESRDSTKDDGEIIDPRGIWRKRVAEEHPEVEVFLVEKNKIRGNFIARVLLAFEGLADSTDVGVVREFFEEANDNFIEAYRGGEEDLSYQERNDQKKIAFVQKLEEAIVQGLVVIEDASGQPSERVVIERNS